MRGRSEGGVAIDIETYDRSLLAYHRSLVTGARRGPAAWVLRALLTLAAWVYALGLALRALAYGRSWFATERAPCPVLSVGNLTAGGTGKTPMVEHVARRLLARGRRPAILSRGYGAERAGAPNPRGAESGKLACQGEATERVGPAGANDEALVLAANLPGVPQVIDADRVRGARVAVEKHGADCVVLDDGFQHRRIERDLDLVLIDALDPFGHGRLLPRGLLREPLRALRRADAIAITRADLVPAERIEEIERTIRRFNPEAPILEVVDEPVALEPAAPPSEKGSGTVLGPDAPPAASREPRWLELRRVAAFCGIGNPDAFLRRLERLGARLVATRLWPDHHAYAPADLAAVAAAARAGDAEAIVTTQKDAVKLREVRGAGEVLVLKIRTTVRRGEADLERLIDRMLEARAAGAGSRRAAPAAQAAEPVR